ncbi:YolD-like family protein [Alicyclobacillus fastidiosus]|uniref:YolD-like family protein n=1 Tax=Alicyclobacillus fastidiosus TaxID=392011 RepID=A0ABV5AIG1_9BACL|nr:YolD-like family protein [Alicyclobacillus fastidiosus]WEH11128.1 YolD-like family protein [Alicyclobacillus fastidiosus]
MKIDEGNVFEMMRLVLPEHRGAMSRYHNTKDRRTKPTLSQHEWEEMSYVISDAIDSASFVRLTLFGPIENEVCEGVPAMYAGELHLITDGGRRRIPVERLISVTGNDLHNW